VGDTPYRTNAYEETPPRSSELAETRSDRLYLWVEALGFVIQVLLSVW
jgi:hypothetical protein